MSKQRFTLVTIVVGAFILLAYVVSFYFLGGKHAVVASNSPGVDWPTKVRAWMYKPIALIDRPIEARRDLAPLVGSWRIAGDGIMGTLNVHADFSYVFWADCIGGELHGSGELADVYDRADLYCRAQQFPDCLVDIMELPDEEKNTHLPPKDGCYRLLLCSEYDAALHRYTRQTYCVLEPASD